MLVNFSSKNFCPWTLFRDFHWNTTRMNKKTMSEETTYLLSDVLLRLLQKETTDPQWERNHDHKGTMDEKQSFVWTWMETILELAAADGIQVVSRETQLENLGSSSCRLLNAPLLIIWKKKIVIPPNSNTFSDWRRTCHVPRVKTHLLPSANKTHSHLIRSCTLKPRQNCVPAGVKKIIFAVMAAERFVCSIFALGGITKHLMTGRKGNSEFYFPSTLNLPLSFASGNIKGLGETKLTVSLGASH